MHVQEYANAEQKRVCEWLIKSSIDPPHGAESRERRGGRALGGKLPLALLHKKIPLTVCHVGIPVPNGWLIHE